MVERQARRSGSAGRRTMMERQAQPALPYPHTMSERQAQPALQVEHRLDGVAGELVISRAGFFVKLAGALRVNVIDGGIHWR